MAIIVEFLLRLCEPGLRSKLLFTIIKHQTRAFSQLQQRMKLTRKPGQYQQQILGYRLEFKVYLVTNPPSSVKCSQTFANSERISKFVSLPIV